MGRKKMRLRFTLMVLVVLALPSFRVLAQDQSGFISIDCGIPANSSYKDSTTGLNYVSDASFIDTGTSYSITAGSLTHSIDSQLQNLRSFPDGVRNCYNISITKGTKYLIRATFLYGNYDGSNKLPSFDLYLGVSKWVKVEIFNVSDPVAKELIHTTTTSDLYVCLVNTGFGTPFISVLELRPLKNTAYVTKWGSLAVFDRWDVGSKTGQIVRYPADIYDRLWLPRNHQGLTDLSAEETIDSMAYNDFQPPWSVLRTASAPTNESKPLQLYYNNFETSLPVYVCAHFVEIERLQSNQSRTFNFSFDGRVAYGPITPKYLSLITVFSGRPYEGGYHLLTMFRVGNSTLPPLLNAIEFYYAVNLSHSLTNSRDVDAITNVKSTYGIKRNWQGDPCAPLDYAWWGLNCSSDGDSPVIISLNLSSSGLKGEIAPDIANLNFLQFLDLSNNNLTGQVPEFLTQLKSLKTLNLDGNNFYGTVPAGLLERSKSGALSLSIELCPLSSHCTRARHNLVVPVVGSIAAVLFVLFVAIILFWSLRRRKKPGMSNVACKRGEPLESKQRQFSYSEVLEMTNNFQQVLGKGGFGSVYYGYFEDTEVAVKMLSPSSVQGSREFHAEVKLLLRVHHKNLTFLVGYCDEGTNMGLIYEYMDKGNLKDHLSGDNQDVLSWERRLRISHEAAQGLEYLHNGCMPPIIHRDVKTTNILLNDQFQAKLSDFGLSKTFSLEGGSHVTTIVAGTPGYLDPEYHVMNRLSKKSDVFSFGVVLLEIITCRPVIAKTHEKTHISGWVQTILETGDVKSIVDPRLQGEFEIGSVWKIVELAMACVSTTSARRPTMSQVVIDLYECLTAEMARTKERGYGYQSGDSTCTDILSVNVHTGLSPLVR